MNEIRHSNNPGNTEEQGWVKKIESWFLSSPIVGHLKCKKKVFCTSLCIIFCTEGNRAKTRSRRAFGFILNLYTFCKFVSFIGKYMRQYINGDYDAGEIIFFTAGDVSLVTAQQTLFTYFSTPTFFLQKTFSQLWSSLNDTSIFSW